MQSFKNAQALLTIPGHIRVFELQCIQCSVSEVRIFNQINSSLQRVCVSEFRRSKRKDIGPESVKKN